MMIFLDVEYPVMERTTVGKAVAKGEMRKRSAEE
jgi:hypothetical protein